MPTHNSLQDRLVQGPLERVIAEKYTGLQREKEYMTSPIATFASCQTRVQYDYHGENIPRGL